MRHEGFESLPLHSVSTRQVKKAGHTMSTSTDPSTLFGGGETTLTPTESRIQRAQEASRRGKQMHGGLQAFARALTRNPNLQLILSGSENPRTDGARIWLRIPIELGDKMTHDRHLCGKRDEVTGKHLCHLHQVLEGVETRLYHEIAHIAFDSFEALSDDDKLEIITRRLAELGTDDTTRVGKLARQLEDETPPNYWAAAKIVSPYLPGVLNALEDARVNIKMYRARPGTWKMFRAQVISVFEDGIERPDGSISFWSDAPRNIQLICGLYAKAAGFDYRGWFSDEVADALDDPQLSVELAKVNTARSTKGIYRIGFPVLEHMRRLGFCKRVEDVEDDEPKANEETGDDENNVQGEADRKDEEGQSDSGPNVPEDDGEPQTVQSESDDEDGDSDQAAGEPESSDDSEDGEDGDGAESDQEASDGSDGSEPGDSDGDPGGESEDTGTGDGSEDGSDGDGSGDDEADGTDGSGDSDSDSAGSGAGDEDSDEDGDGAPGDGAYEDDDEDSEGDPATGNAGGGEPGENEVECKSCGEEFDPHQEGQVYNHEAGGPLCGSCEDINESGDDSDGGEADETADSGGLGGSANSANAGNEDGESDDGLGVPEDDDEDSDDGSPEDCERALKVFGGHGHDDELPTVEEMADQAEVERAVQQGDHFDEPSRNVFGVNEHYFGKPVYNKNGFDLSARFAWYKREHKCPYCQRQVWEESVDCRAKWNHEADDMGYRIEVDASLITASLGRLRVVFSDNRKARQVRNLKAGRINTKALRRVPVQDDRLFQKKREPGAKDYFVVIGLDNSGSTAGRELGVIKAAGLHKAEMLTKLGIDFAMYAHNGSPHGYAGSFHRTNTMDLDIVVIKAPGERWTEVTRQRLRDLGPGGFNLDGHALEYYRKACDGHRATDKVILYYTDGAMPNENYEEELHTLQREIRTCVQRGYSVVGIGVGTDSPRKHGLDTIQIDSVEDVPLVVKELERRLNQKVRVA